MVLYETHSELEIENEDMVDKTMKEMNKLAKFRHAVLQGKIKSTNSQTELFLQVLHVHFKNEHGVGVTRPKPVVALAETARATTGDHETWSR